MPGLPRCGAPRPLVLPTSDVLRSVDECLRDDGLDKTGDVPPPAEPADDVADEATSPAAAGLCGGTGGVPDHEGDDEELGKSASFQRLLLDLAAEHRRALARARLEAAAAAVAPLADLEGKFAIAPEEAALQEVPQEVPPEGPAWTQRSRTQSSEVLLSDQELSAASPRGEDGRRGSRTVLSVRSSLFDAHSESTKGSGSDDGRSPPLREAPAPREGSLTHFLARLKVLVRSQAFDCASGIAIVLNSIQLGWSANYSVMAAVEGHPPDMLPFYSQVATVFFTVWFATELLLKFIVSGPREFFASEADGRWNVFDSLVVGSDMVHTGLELLSVDVADGLGIQNLTVVRMIRILRITRVVRVIRLIRFFRELRMMVLSVLRAGASLLWSLLLLSVTIYVFGVYFCQIVAYHVYEETLLAGSAGLQGQEVLLDMFGNLLRAEYILYQAIAGGINWGDIGKPLMEIHPFHVFSLSFFTFFTTFALLNIITGIFVQTAIHNAQNDKDDMIQEQMHQTEIALKEMKRIFKSADLDDSGALTLPEFEVHLKNPEVRAHLGSIGIEISRAKGVFRLLDLDMSGEINIDEFVNGCMKLKGTARSVDLAMLMYENLTLAQEWRNFAEWSEQQFEQVSAFERRVDDKLSTLLGERY